VLLAISLIVLTCWHWEFLPAAFFVALLVTDDERESLPESRLREGAPPTPEELARRFAKYGILAIAGAVFVIWRPAFAGAWWIALICALLALRQVPAEEGSDLTSRITLELRKNFLELLVLTALVLALANVLLWRFDRIPLPAITVSQLQSLEGQIEHIHSRLESYKPGVTTLVIVALLFAVARVLSKRVPALVTPTTVAGRVIPWALRWSGRLSTTFALAAAFTLLATSDRGPIKYVRLTLRDVREEYANLAGELIPAVETATRSLVLQGAWDDAPKDFKAAIQDASLFDVQRAAYEEERRKFNLSDARVEEAKQGIPSPVKLENKPGPVTQPSISPSEAIDPSWSVERLQAARRMLPDELARAHDESKADGRSNPIPELIAELGSHIDFLRLDPQLEILKSHYPVIGQFFEAIAKAAVRSGYDQLREHIAKRVAVACITGTCDDIRSAIPEYAQAPLEVIRADWSPFDRNWIKSNRADLARYTAALHLEREEVEPSAREVRRDALAAARESMDKVIRQLERIGDAFDNSHDKNIGRAAKAATNALDRLGATWPGEKTPSDAQIRALAQLRSKVASILDTHVSEAETPEQVMSELADGCHGISQRIIEFTRNNPAGAILAKALGEEDYKQYLWEIDKPARERQEQNDAQVRWEQQVRKKQEEAERRAAEIRVAEWAKMAK
jgi:hypothetical protein